MKTLTLAVSDFKDGEIKEGIVEMLKKFFPNKDIDDMSYFEVEVTDVEADDI